MRDKQVVRIAGLFTEMKRIQTKKGETMCFATLEDFTDSMEIIIFPRVFYEHVNACVVDEAVVLQGRIDLQDDGAKLLVDKIWELSEYQPEYYIKVLPEKDTPATMDALRNVFQTYHGDHIVYLQLKGRWQKTGTNYWLQGSDDVRKALVSILGEAAVHIR